MTSPGLLILALVVAIAVVLYYCIEIECSDWYGYCLFSYGSYGWTRFAHYNIDDCVWIWKYDDKYRFTGWFWYDSWTAYE